MNMDQLNTTYLIVFDFKETKTDIVLQRSYCTRLDIWKHIAYELYNINKNDK